MSDLLRILGLLEAQSSRTEPSEYVGLRQANLQLALTSANFDWSMSPPRHGAGGERRVPGFVDLPVLVRHGDFRIQSGRLASAGNPTVRFDLDVRLRSDGKTAKAGDFDCGRAIVNSSGGIVFLRDRVVLVIYWDLSGEIRSAIVPG